MSPVQEVYLVTQRELRKNLTNWKGIVLLTLSLLAGAGASIIKVILDRSMQKEFAQVDAETINGAFTEALKKWYDDAPTAAHLGQSSNFEWSLALAVVIGLPLLVTILGFDSVATDMRHRTLRFWSVRCRRPSLFIGRFLGLWVTVSAMLLMANLVVWLVLAIGGSFSAGHVLTWGLRYWSMYVPIVGAWSALTMLVGSQFRSPFLALLAISTTFIVMTLIKAIGLIPNFANWMRYVSPNSMDEFILSPTPTRLLTGLGVCLAFIFVSMSAGTVIFTKRDV